MPSHSYYMVKMKMRATPPEQKASKELTYLYGMPSICIRVRTYGH